ncbi:MAG: alpha/beta hydrolase [Bacteroidota bacterium]
MKTRKVNVNGESIAYLDNGKGDVSLLLIHGAFINKEYWSQQLSHFSKTYRVLALDLPGHGDSSYNRTDWTVQNYGRDICGFIKELSLQNVILIGHSFGSDVMLEAAALDATQIKGLVEVDHMKNVGVPLPKETIEHLGQSLRTDFKATCEQFARQVLVTERTNPELVNRLLHDFGRVNPEVGIPLLENTFSYTKREIELLRGLDLKLNLLHVDYMPTSEENLQRYLADNYQVHTLSGTCHYPMIESPDKFNMALENILDKLTN